MHLFTARGGQQLSKGSLTLAGVQIQTVFEGNLAPNLARPPYTLDSTARYSYQKPVLKDELMGNNSRYGCNRNKYQPAVGSGE